MSRTVARTQKNLADDLTWQLPPTKVNGGQGRITKPQYRVKDEDPKQVISSQRSENSAKNDSSD